MCIVYYGIGLKIGCFYQKIIATKEIIEYCKCVSIVVEKNVLKDEIEHCIDNSVILWEANSQGK